MTSSLYLSTTAAGSGKALVSLGILELILRRTPQGPLFSAPDSIAGARSAPPGRGY